jgi:hypothetical protein
MLFLCTKPDCRTLSEHRHTCPDSRRKIPVIEWQTVLERIDQNETLRKVAEDYGVCYEAVRRGLRAVRRKTG